MNREELEALSMEELVRYANLNYGLGVTKDYNRFDIYNQIEQAQRKFKGNALMRVVGKGDNGRVGPGMMKIRIRPGKYDRIPRPVIIGHQFKIASVPVNCDVIMPARYLVCFEDAIQDTYFTDEATKDWVCQAEHAYSYSVLEMGPVAGSKPTPRAVAAKPEVVRREVEEAPAPDPVLAALAALSGQLTTMSERLDAVEAKNTAPVKKAPVKRKPRAKSGGAKA